MRKIIFIILLFGLNSCDILSTRTPEQPTTVGNNNIPATTPDILFANFKTSIESKILENYSYCFVDQAFLKKEFTFIPSSGSMSQYPVLSAWNMESEKQYFRNQTSISNQGNSISLGLSNALATQLGDSAVYQIDYNLSIQTADVSVKGSYLGTAQFKIFLDKRNQWVIAEWTDLRNGTSRSWSDLKGRLDN